MYMKKIHNDKPKRGVVLGKPFDDAIEKYLLPKTNTNNLSNKWNRTDWTRYALAQEIARRNNGKIPKACKDMLKEFTADLDV
jgi:hypothetical protein